MKKFILLGFMLVLAFAFSESLAQDRTVSGRVTSVEDGASLPGVNVILKGSTTGTVTDLDGNYLLTVPSSGGILVFSFIGLASEEVEIGSRSVIDLQMTGDVKQLSEVVVVGYGTQSKRNLTSSVSSVSGDELMTVPVPTFQGALQGKAAGVNITQASGTLGAPVTVRVRGTGSVNASNQPLFIVDGIPISFDNGAEADIVGGSAFGGQGTNALSNINPNDIESIEILKDAGASAIYGARGANGVVIITTKKGKAGKTRVNLNYYAGVSEPTQNLDMLSGPEYARLRNYAGFNTFGYNWLDPVSGSASLTDEVPDTDHIDLVTQTAFLHEFNANISGGSEKTQFYVGASYRDEEGWVRRTNFERFSGRVNIDHRLSDKLRLEFRINPTRTINLRQGDDNAIAAPYTNGALSRPDLPGRNEDGTPFLGNLFGGSPLGNLENQTRMLTTNQVLSNINFDYEIIEGLSFRTEFGVDFLNNREEDRTLGDHTDSGARNGEGFVTNAEVLNLNWNNLLNYDLSWDVHNLNLTTGISYQSSESFTSFASGNTFGSPLLPNLASAAEPTDAESTGTEFKFINYLLRANYIFNEKYLFSLTGSYNGSSRFGEDNRYGFFPAVSAGWIISEESFMDNITQLSFLKLRASYGRTGNAEIANFAARGLIGFGRNYNLQPGFEQTSLPNPNLSWETTDQLDIAVEFGLFGGRIQGSLGYYNKNTSDLLLEVPLPSESGIETLPVSIFTDNIGEMINRGFEFELSADIIQGDFSWSANFNLATLTNEVTSLADNDGDGRGDDIISDVFIIREGEPINSFWLVEYAGVDPENGDALFRDLEGSVSDSYSSANAQIAGDPFPDFFGGFNNTFTYKGFDLGVFFQYTVGNDIYRAEAEFSQTNLFANFNQQKSQLSTWTPENPNTDVPQARRFQSNGNQPSTRYLEDGSFLRLRTVSLGYTLPKDWTKGFGVRVYAQGLNLLTFTDYEGADPEVSFNDPNGALQGETFFSRPQSRVITLGVNVNF